MSTRRKCEQCGRGRADRFYTSPLGRKCSDCRRKNTSDANHRRRILQTYGLTAGEYDALLERQGDACAICRGERRYRLNVDHDHTTGRVRGLLCRRCNKLLRDVRDEWQLLAEAISYLQHPPAVTLGIEATAP